MTSKRCSSLLYVIGYTLFYFYIRLYWKNACIFDIIIRGAELVVTKQSLLLRKISPSHIFYKNFGV